MLKMARRVDRVNHDRFLYKTAVALIIFTNFTLTVIGYNSIPWIKIEQTNTKQNNGSYAFDKVTKKGYLSNFQEDLDALFDFYHSKEKGSKRDKYFINAYMQQFAWSWTDSVLTYYLQIILIGMQALGFVSHFVYAEWNNSGEHSIYYSCLLYYMASMVLDCAQAIGNVDTIEHLNANTKAINYNLRLNSEGLLTLPTFFSIEPPGFYFSVIAIRIALKCILFGILVELIDPS